MSDSVVPTPSEKPTCEHGETEAHTYICVWQFGSGVQDVHDWCPGPVIATEPEKCAPDPTPELRKRIEALRPSRDRFLTAYEEGRRDAIYDVLDALGEPK